MDTNALGSHRAEQHNEGTELITKEQLSALTGYSVSTILRLVKNKRIPFVQPGGPRTLLRFPRDCAQRLLIGESISQVSDTNQPTESKPRRYGPRLKWQDD